MVHKWVDSIPNPCRLGGPQRFSERGGISGPLLILFLSPSGERNKIRSGPLVGGLATSPMPSKGSPMCQRGGWGQNQIKIKIKIKPQ